ncbi:MAG: methylated-DNA--[protein]-cysteine S-methyltransferase [Rhodococcus sp. (in: high G+C Gram-positive bacteria)]
MGDALAGVYFPAHAPAPAPARLGRRSDDGFDGIVEQFSDYFDGRRTSFDLPLEPAGTEFQHSVWAALRTIPYGETWTYSQLAVAIGRPSAVRAVASANARNPLSIVVPCHRVVGMSGSLTGFAGGVARKRFLLDLESGEPSLFD